MRLPRRETLCALMLLVGLGCARRASVDPTSDAAASASGESALVASVRPRPGALLDTKRIECNLDRAPGPPRSVEFDPSQDLYPSTKLVPDPGTYAYPAIWEDSSEKFGRVLYVDDGCTGIGHAELGPRSYILGNGVADECGSLTYHSALSPGFGDVGRILLGAQPRDISATFVDHRRRSPSCRPSIAPLIFTEESPGSTALTNGCGPRKALFPRTAYGAQIRKCESYESSEECLKKRTMIGIEPKAKPPGVCPFFTTFGHRTNRVLERCEVATYFAEDDLPILGKKLVVLEDFGNACENSPLPAWVAGLRFYTLERGGTDSCGSVAFGSGPIHTASRINNEEGTNHGLTMYDHRGRRVSEGCAKQPALVELNEAVKVVRDGEVAVYTRRFFAPVGAVRPPR